MKIANNACRTYAIIEYEVPSILATIKFIIVIVINPYIQPSTGNLTR